jgi:predicted nucleic-acid-binding protein
MRAVDTNVLVRLVTRDDAAQVDAAEAFVVQGAWVSTLVLAETVWVLSAVYELEPTSIAKAVSMLLEHDKLTLEHADAVADALEDYERRPSKVSFSDCLVLELARNAGHVPLGTFDRELGRLDGVQRLEN